MVHLASAQCTLRFLLKARGRRTRERQWTLPGGFHQQQGLGEVAGVVCDGAGRTAGEGLGGARGAEGVE